MDDRSKANHLRGSSVGDLALSRHREMGRGLRLEPPAELELVHANLPAGCKLVTGAIEFDSLADRNRIVAAAAFEGLCRSSGHDFSPLFSCAYELWRGEIGHADQASGRLLALASEFTDVLALGNQSIRDGARVFNVLHLIVAALPYLEKIDLLSVIDLFDAKFEPTKNDMAAGVIHGALEAWLETRPSVALELRAKVLDGLSEATAALLAIAVVAMSRSDYDAAVKIARSDVKAESVLQARAGVWALGRLMLDPHARATSRDVVAGEILELIETGQDDIRSQAIGAATSAVHVTPAFDAALFRLGEKGDQIALGFMATELFLRSNELRERGVMHRWLELMAGLRPEFRGALSDLDSAMSNLVTDADYVDAVVAALTQWVATHGQGDPVDSDTAMLFDDTLQQLLQLEPCWSALLTDWLLSDAREHPAVVAGALTQLSHQAYAAPKLDRSKLDRLSADDLMFLARRMLGYVHDRAQLTSLALSMLRSRDAETRIYPVLRALLVDEIGYDYPRSTSTACREAAAVASSEDNKVWLLRIADTVDQNSEAHSALPPVGELRPRQGLRRLFARARAKQMSDSFEEAHKDAAWRQIATQITIKAGRGTFSYRNESYGQSMKLSSMSHTIELPRREIFDPIGNAIRHLGFRLAKRDPS